MNKIIYYWRELNATFWFIPVIIIISSILTAFIFVSIDHHYEFHKKGYTYFFIVNSADSARSILSTISGAMMGVAGTIFSITLVVLQLASSQFGSRLIKNFMHVRLNQIVLGLYVSTYLYCLLVLNAVKDANDYSFVPSVSIIVAILITIVNIILLIIYIHQVATSIQADAIIFEISKIISKRVEEIFPEKLGEEVDTEKETDVEAYKSKYNKSIDIKAPKNGYLQYVDDVIIIELLTNNDGLLELYFRPGRYLVKDKEIAKLFINDEWEQEKIDLLLNHFIIGSTKTTQQDLEYSIQQLVEIASRALSSGVNDPFTAIACIDNLTSTLTFLASAKFPSKYRYSEDGELKVIADVLEFEGLLDTAFNQIRQYSANNIAVSIRLMEALITIYDFTRKSSHKKAVVKHAEMVLNIGKESIKESNDLADLEQRANKILNQ